ncbi:MAG: rotamase, partial [Gammaproteobacteria bacterium]|nr:rotamase [Gammaproteobacteria bacterium]
MSKKILIFLLIALFLYLFDWFLNNDNENMIYVSDNDIDFLVATWNDQMQRPPSEEELKTIIENFIQNEVLYRE